MDTRIRYGLGVFVLGIGNLAYGLALLTVGDQSTLFVALEIVLGLVMGGFGALVLTDPDRIDPEEISPRIMAVVGWVGIALGIGLLAYTAVLVVTSL